MQRRAALAVEAGQQPVGGEDGEARVLERDEAHQHVVGRRASGLRRRARSRSGGGRRRSAARCRRAPSRTAAIASASATRQSRCTVPSSSVTSPHGVAVDVRRERAPGRAGRVVVEAEDRREVRARRAGQAQPVLLRARVGALVRADAAGAVVLDAHAGEEAVAGARRGRRARCSPARAPTAPARRRGRATPSALPRVQHGGGVGVGVAAVAREVDLDDVVRRAGAEAPPAGRRRSRHRAARRPAAARRRGARS